MISSRNLCTWKLITHQFTLFPEKMHGQRQIPLILIHQISALRGEEHKQREERGSFEVPEPRITSRMASITCSNCKLVGHRYTSCSVQLRPSLQMRKNQHKENRGPGDNSQQQPASSTPAATQQQPAAAPASSRPHKQASPAAAAKYARKQQKQKAGAATYARKQQKQQAAEASNARRQQQQPGAAPQASNARRRQQQQPEAAPQASNARTNARQHQEASAATKAMPPPARRSAPRAFTAPRSNQVNVDGGRPVRERTKSSRLKGYLNASKIHVKTWQELKRE